MSIEIDLSEPDFETWLKRVFDHPIKAEGEKDWYWNELLEFVTSSPWQLVANMTQLCNQFAAIAPRYSIDQVDQGIWYLLAARGELGNLLMDRSIAQDKRVACVESMFHVYSDFLAHVPIDQPLPTCFNMWWDLLCVSFWGEVRTRTSGWLNPEDAARLSEILTRSRGIEDFRKRFQAERGSEPTRADLDKDELVIHDAILRTLTRILGISNRDCEQAALHGLGHLRHPQGAVVVQQFIDAHRGECDARQIAWLEQCRDGTVM